MDDRSVEREWLTEVGMRVRVARVRRRETPEQLAARATVSRVTLGSIDVIKDGSEVRVTLSCARARRKTAPCGFRSSSLNGDVCLS